MTVHPKILNKDLAEPAYPPPTPGGLLLILDLDHPVDRLLVYDPFVQEELTDA